MKTFFILAALLFSAQWLLGQESQSPLPLFISGSGKIVPFHNGQMLDDGRDFVMTAVPNKGYVFASWQQVNIFTFDEYFLNSNGQIIERVSTVPSFSPPEPEKNRVLHFTMQPEQYLFDDPNVRIITQSVGWQANFVPAPRKQHGK